MEGSQSQLWWLCTNDITPSLSYHLWSRWEQAIGYLLSIIFSYCIFSASSQDVLWLTWPLYFSTEQTKKCIQSWFCTSCSDASMWLSCFIGTLGWQKTVLPYLDTHTHWKYTRQIPLSALHCYVVLLPRTVNLALIYHSVPEWYIIYIYRYCIYTLELIKMDSL